VDPLTSRSRLLEAGLLDPEHRTLATRIRAAIPAALAAPGPGPAPDGNTGRARKLLRFFAQPFYVTEPYTRRPGVTVPLAETLGVCREVLDGIHDGLPDEAFSFTGGITGVRARAAAIPRERHGRPRLDGPVPGAYTRSWRAAPQPGRR
jgi:F-type H+-transporting ATPase subunit beta